MSCLLPSSPPPSLTTPPSSATPPSLTPPPSLSHAYLSECSSEGADHATRLALTKLAPLVGVTMPMQDEGEGLARRLMGVLDNLPASALQPLEVRERCSLWEGPACCAEALGCQHPSPPPPPPHRMAAASRELLATPSPHSSSTARHSCTAWPVSPVPCQRGKPHLSLSLQTARVISVCRQRLTGSFRLLSTEPHPPSSLLNSHLPPLPLRFLADVLSGTERYPKVNLTLVFHPCPPVLRNDVILHHRAWLCWSCSTVVPAVRRPHPTSSSSSPCSGAQCFLTSSERR